jgi:hypothetical protein
VLENVFLSSHSFLPGEQWGGEPLATYWARASSEYVHKAELLASGAVIRVGPERHDERIYFDDRWKCRDYELKRGAPSPKVRVVCLSCMSQE